MNNTDFQKLIRDGGGTKGAVGSNSTKSNKEIAREAVEAEFSNRRRKRRSHGADGYSDDSADENGDRHSRRRTTDLQPTQLRRKKELAGDSKYRDRAQERREGVVDTDLPPDLSTILVDRGHEIKKHNKLTLTSLEEEIVSPFPKDLDEVKALILSGSIVCKTNLGKDVLSYLERKFHDSIADAIVEVTPAGRVAQRTAFTFSIRAHPGDIKHAWDVPNEQTFASDLPSGCEMVSRLSGSLLGRINQALTREHVQQNQSTAQNSSNENNREKAIAEDMGTGSDEDIFENVGEYDPTADEDGAAKPTVVGPIFGIATVSKERISHKDTVSNLEHDLSLAGKLSGFTPTGGYDDDADMDYDMEAADRGDESDDSAKKKRKKRKNKETSDE